MKNTIKIIFAFITFISLVAFTVKASKREKLTVLKVKSLPISITTVELKPTLDIKLKTHSDFLAALGKKESGNNYKVVNTYGYLGRYQFGEKTLKGLGYRISKEEFLNSPFIQESAMQKLLQHNRKKLSKYIEKFDNKVVNGVLVTESGVLAAAHLAGAGNVRKWFRNGKDPKDGYGSSLSLYMSKFQGYNLNLSNEGK